MTNINFKTKSIMKNMKRCLKASNHIQNGEIVRFSTGSKHKVIFPRNRNVDEIIKLIISELNENPLIHNNFSIDFLEEKIIFILEELQINSALTLPKKEFDKICEKLLIEFENEIKRIVNEEFNEYECIFHVDNLELSRTIKLGKVTFFQFNSDCKKYSDANDKLLGEKFFKDKNVYAKTKIYGSKEYAIIQSQIEIKIAINLLKLLLPEHSCNFNLDGDTLLHKYRHHLIFDSEKIDSEGWELQNTNFGCNFDKDSGNIDYELYVLSILFNRTPKSEFENRLLTSIYWFGEALSVKRNEYSKIEKKHSTQLNNLEFFDLYPKLLNLVICLETLFVFGDEHKSQAISTKVSKLISNPGAQENIEFFLNNIYKYRSKIVHAGNIYISKKEINTLIDYTRLALFYVISLNYKYSDKINYFKKIYPE